MTSPTNPSSPPQWPGYAVASGNYSASPIGHTSHTRLFVILGVTLAVVTGVIVLVAWLLTPPPSRYQCPPDCGRPPIGPPVGTLPGEGGGGPPVPTKLPDPPLGMTANVGGRTDDPVVEGGAVGENAGPDVQPQTAPPVYTLPRLKGTDGEFSVAYPPKARKSANGWSYQWKVDGKDNGTVLLYGVPAENLTPRQIAESIVKANYPSAVFAYEIPNSMVGYRNGYGEVDDWYPQSGSASYTRQRVLVMVGIKNGVALIASAVGPYHEFTPDEIGHPSAANVQIAAILGYFANTFAWKGDPLR
jgi:hypothetical protein